MTLKQALWEIVRDENIIITNQNIDWLLDRALKRASGDAQALKESILERKGVIEENIPCALTNEEKVSEKDKLLLINEDKSNNFEVKSNEELFKQALVEGLNRRFDREIEEAKKIEQIEELAKVIDYTFVLAEGVGAVRPSSRMIAMDLYDADFRKQSEWISVADRLPDCEWGAESEAVLFITKQGFMYTGYYGCGGVYRDRYFREYKNSTDGYDISNITHWMPLPEAPKMKGGE